MATASIQEFPKIRIIDDKTLIFIIIGLPLQLWFGDGISILYLWQFISCYEFLISVLLVMTIFFNYSRPIFRIQINL